MWTEVSTKSQKCCRQEHLFFPIPAQAHTLTIQMTESGEQVIFLPLPLPTTCSYTSKPWKEPSSQPHLSVKSLAVVSMAESPSEACVKSQHPTCAFPHHCQLVTSIQKGHFWCADSFPCPIHSSVCPWSLLHSLPRFTNILAVLGHDQRLFIYGHLEGVFPPLPSVLAHSPTPLSCRWMEVAHYNRS